MPLLFLAESFSASLQLVILIEMKENLCNLPIGAAGLSGAATAAVASVGGAVGWLTSWLVSPSKKDEKTENEETESEEEDLYN